MSLFGEKKVMVYVYFPVDTLEKNVWIALYLQLWVR